MAEVWVCPILHPAAIVRGRWGDFPAQVEYLKRVHDLVRGDWEPEDITRVPPTAKLAPSLPDLHEWAAHPQLHEGIAVDIETARSPETGRHELTLVGLARMCDEAYVCVPFPGEATHHDWLYDMLASDVPKVFQNGQAFDVPFLEQRGFEVACYAFDTLLAQRHAYPEMPADLAFLGALYGRLPNWKWLVREEVEGK